MAVPLTDNPVGLLVSERASRAAVFERFGIDYCCGGKLSIRWFCDKRGLALEAVLEALEAAERAPEREPARDWTRAPLAELIAHIVSTHHDPARAALQRLTALSAAVREAHGAARPDLVALEPVLARFRAELEAHMAQEERVVFPLIIRLERGLEDQALGKRFLSQQLARMGVEHHEAGRDLDEMAALTQGFTPPDGACDSHRALLSELAEVFADTHRHVHKENSILFPRAAELIGQAPAGRPGASLNRGPIVFPEKHPLDPSHDEATSRLTHRGGLASARAELY